MARDERQFRDFVHARWVPLVRYAYLLTGDAMHAEDLVQTALERTWRRWGHIDTERPEAYVRTAIARQAVSRFRARRCRVAEVPLTMDARPERAVEWDGTAGWDLHDLVWAELVRLPPRMRAVVVLRVWEDRSVQETADLLGCSAGAVKSQLSRALGRLRDSAPIREVIGLDPTMMEVTR